MLRFQTRSYLKGLCAVSLFLFCLSGCKSNAPAPGDAAAKSDGAPASGPTLGPPDSEIQADLIAGLPQYINDYCHKDKAAMLSSVSGIRFKSETRELANTEAGYPIVRIGGKLYWDYESKESHEDPSVGSQFSVVMTQNPDLNQKHTKKWDFLGLGSWSYMLMFEQDKNCVGFS